MVFEQRSRSFAHDKRQDLRSLRSRRWIALGQGLRGAGGQRLRRRGQQRVLGRLANRLAARREILLVDEVEILVPYEIKLLQDLDDCGLTRAVIFRIGLHDGWSLRQEAPFEVEL